MGCHFLLQCMKVKSEGEVAQSCLTLNDPMDLQPTRLLHPWDFPGKGTGVGCHCLRHFSSWGNRIFSSEVASGQGIPTFTTHTLTPLFKAVASAPAFSCPSSACISPLHLPPNTPYNALVDFLCYLSLLTRLWDFCGQEFYLFFLTAEFKHLG